MGCSDRMGCVIFTVVWNFNIASVCEVSLRYKHYIDIMSTDKDFKFLTME